MSQTADIGDEIVAAFRKFKLSKSKTTNVMIFKINVKELKVEVEDTVEGVNFDNLREDLPVSTPRFIVMSYEWKMEDDRVSYPLIFLYYSPEASAKLNMLYASTKARLSKALDLNKEFDFKDPETLTEDWLKSKLAFFK